MSQRNTGDVRVRIAEAGLRLLQRTNFGDLCRFFTVEAIRNEMRSDRWDLPSSETIRKAASRFGGGAFSRDAVVDLVLERAFEDILATAQANASGYIQAAEAIKLGAGPEVILAAVAGDLKDWAAGSTGEAAMRDRAYYLALAVCDVDRVADKRLRAVGAASEAAYRIAYEAFLQATNRQLATGVSHTQLFVAISGYVEGVTAFRRSGSEIGDRTVAETMMRIFWAHTRPRHSPEHNYLSELWSAVSSPRDGI